MRCALDCGACLEIAQTEACPRVATVHKGARPRVARHARPPNETRRRPGQGEGAKPVRNTLAPRPNSSRKPALVFNRGPWQTEDGNGVRSDARNGFPEGAAPGGCWSTACTEGVVRVRLWCVAAPWQPSRSIAAPEGSSCPQRHPTSVAELRGIGPQLSHVLQVRHMIFLRGRTDDTGRAQRV